jgi:hypothetical protein
MWVQKWTAPNCGQFNQPTNLTLLPPGASFPRQAILFQLVFAVVPTLVELAITATVLTQRCGEKYAFATLATFLAYCAYTSWVTEWRMAIRRNLVRLLILIIFVLLCIVLRRAYRDGS